MMERLVSLLFIASVIVVTNPQKVAPGVNPSQYQQPPPPPPQQYQPPPPPPPQQQYQQQQPPQQQPPQQQHPQQHHQQPIQSAVPQDVHQPPAGHHQGGHAHHGQPQILNAANLAEEKEHMQEHLNVNIDTSKMTEQELQFHYFKMHDADNNNKLDGCELIKSLIHWHGDSPAEQEMAYTDDDLSNHVDSYMSDSDKNNDGYIDWVEFAASEEKDGK